jgi:hypothetical protein
MRVPLLILFIFSIHNIYENDGSYFLETIQGKCGAAIPMSKGVTN